MFLHLGGDVVIPIRDIISIIDISTIGKAKDTKEFLKIAEEEGFIHKISQEEPKSCIITEKAEPNKKGCKKGARTIIYYSHISSTTLQKRAESFEDMNL